MLEIHFEDCVSLIFFYDGGTGAYIKTPYLKFLNVVGQAGIQKLN